MENQTQAEFLKDLDIKPEDTFEKPLTEETPAKEESEEEGFQAKNRRERRLLEQNQRLREEAIATTARLQGITEAQKLRETTEEADFLKMIDPIYGTDTPEKAEATNLLKKALKGLHEDAIRRGKEESLQEFSSRETKADEAVAQEEQTLDDMLNNIEDDNNIELSDTDRKGFLTLLEKLSPKDKEGNIIEYADASTTYEIYESRKERPSNRAKELAARGQVRSGQSGASNLEVDSNERFLRENGII